MEAVHRPIPAVHHPSPKHTHAHPPPPHPPPSLPSRAPQVGSVEAVNRAILAVHSSKEPGLGRQVAAFLEGMAVEAGVRDGLRFRLHLAMGLLADAAEDALGMAAGKRVGGWSGERGVVDWGAMGGEGWRGCLGIRHDC